MATIKRTALADAPRAAVWIGDPWSEGQGGHFADWVHEDDYPSHSPILGPDGVALQYEPRPAMGFDLTRRKA